MSAYSSSSKYISEESTARAKRIRHLMHLKSFRQTQLSDITGATRGAVSKWVAGENVPSGDYIIALAQALDTTPEWILKGDDAALDLAQNQPDTSNILIYKEVEALNRLSLISSGKYIQINNDVAAAAGASISDTYCYINNSYDMSPKISYGAECLVDSSKSRVRDGMTYLIEHGVLLRVRTIFKRHDGGLLLKAVNEAYDDEVVAQQNLHDIKILGWVYRVANLEEWQGED